MSMKSSDFSERVYDDGRTKQAFKDSTDVNRLLNRHAKAGTLAHLAEHENVYGDFAGYDFHEHQNRIAAGVSLFESAPSEVRREFGNDPQKFFDFVNHPDNVGKLAEKLPALAAPGRQLPKINPRVEPMTPSGVASEPQASETTTTQPDLQVSGENPSPGATDGDTPS